MALKWEWEPVEDIPEYDLTPAILEPGAPMPDWFFNALARKEVVPLAEIDDVGSPDHWGDKGMRVVKTGEEFPVGSWVYKGDLFSRSI